MEVIRMRCYKTKSFKKQVLENEIEYYQQRYYLYFSRLKKLKYYQDLYIFISNKNRSHIYFNKYLRLW